MKTLNKNLFTSGLAIAMVCAMALPAFADNSNSNFFVPQSVEAIIEHNENGEIYYECRWRDDNGIAMKTQSFLLSKIRIRYRC